MENNEQWRWIVCIKKQRFGSGVAFHRPCASTDPSPTRGRGVQSPASHTEGSRGSALRAKTDPWRASDRLSIPSCCFTPLTKLQHGLRCLCLWINNQNGDERWRMLWDHFDTVSLCWTFGTSEKLFPLAFVLRQGWAVPNVCVDAVSQVRQSDED